MNPLRLLPLVLLLASCGTRTPPAADQAPTPDSSWTGHSRPGEVILARIKVMERMELLMRPIDSLQIEPVKNADQLRANAQSIAAMLQAVPHLFPPTTNLYRPEGPEFPTLALPAIWKNFDAFYNLAMAASRSAEAMGQAQGEVALRAAGSTLRAGCNACHTLYLRKYVPQTLRPSDYEFDFEGALAIE